jgi:signal transduction histidine kinase
LVPALQSLAQQYSHTGLRVSVEAPETLPVLSAAGEVAAYRIAQEAMTNVARHAGARTCTLSVHADTHLVLEISDDGRGFSDERRGVGLTSMRERAEELGGTCVVESVRGTGTTVTARLPLAGGRQ